MTDILIRGMEMPTNVFDCPLNTFGFCNLAHDSNHTYCIGDSRPEWCPLVPLPEGHGDLIDREDAKVFVRHACYKKINPIDYLDEVPAADVRPVVHGEWRNAHPSSPMLDGGGPPYCSVCGKEAPLRSVEVNQWKLERGSLSGPEVVYKTKCFLSNFCPACGADMRGPNLDTTKGDNHD